MFSRGIPRAKVGAALKASDLDAGKPELEALMRAGLGPGLKASGFGGASILGLAGISVAIAKSGSGGVPGIDGVDPGRADVTTYEYNGVGLIPGATVEALNLGTDAVGGNKWLILLKCFGVWWVIFESCS